MPIPDILEETDQDQILKSIAVEWRAMPDLVENLPEDEGGVIPELPKVPGPEEETIECVKCGFKNARKASECVKCGVIFSRVTAHRESLFRVKEDVARAWDIVLTNYENMDLHYKFVHLCSEMSCMPYAAYRYQSILNADASEEVALKMRSYVLAMTEAPALEKNEQALVEKKGKVLRPSLMIIGFVFAFLHFYTGNPTFRITGASLLFIGLSLYLIQFLKSYKEKLDD